MTDAPKRVREGMVVRKYKLGEEPGDDISEHTTLDERVALVWELTERMWLWMGREMPNYERSQMPGRVIRRSAP